MARKRKLNTEGISADISSEETEEEASKLGGFWGGSAMNMLKARLQEAHESLVDGIMQGTVSLNLDPSQIIDEVGSDRVEEWQKDPSFEVLLKDIKRRGQKQAIRVRPSDPNWKPDETKPLETNAKFVVQSGRRRLQVAKELGANVLAVVSTEDGDAALLDLEERFKENTMRKNLSGFEELVSIGLIAAGHKDLTQEQIAKDLGVAQGDVSLGLSCVEFFDEIVAQVNIKETPKREFRSIIPAIRAGTGLSEDVATQSKSKKPKEKFNTMTIRSGKRHATIKRTAKGFALTVVGFEASEKELKQVCKDILSRLDV